MDRKLEVLAAGLLICGCHLSQSKPATVDGDLRLRFHPVKSARDFEIAARYATGYSNMPSSAGVGSLALWQDAKGYKGLDGINHSLILRLPFHRFEDPLDVAFTYAKEKKPVRAWADFDHNKEFSKEEELKPVRFGKRTAFGPLGTRGREGEPVCYVEDSYFSYNFVPVGWMEGEFKSGGKNNVVAAFDSNHDGKYSGSGDWLWDNADHLVVGEYGDDPSATYYRDQWPGAGAIRCQLLDGAFCSVMISENGNRATVEPLASEGELEISARGAQITAHSTTPNVISLSSSKLAMPIGSYDWLQIEARIADGNNKSWRITVFNGRGARYQISAGSRTKLSVGPPVRATSSVEGLGQGSVSYHAELFDEYGNQITDVRNPKGKVVVPKLVVTDANGNVVYRPDWIDQTTLSFSGGDLATKDLPLKFTITWDFGGLGNVVSVALLK